MKATKLTLVAVTLLAMITSCDKGDEPKERTALQITQANITTRAIDNAWEANDAIGICMFNAGTNTPANDKQVYRYITANASSFAPFDNINTAYLPQNDVSTDILAFYPYTDISSDLLVAVNTADQSCLSAIDLMTAERVRGIKESAPWASLAFRHRLVKLVITVDKETTAQFIDLTGATITVAGTASTAKWDLATEALTALGNTADIEVKNIATSNNTINATAIVLPALAGQGVKLVIATAGGKVFQAPLSVTTPLLAGTVNTLKVHLTQTAASMDVSTSDWTAGVTEDLHTLNLMSTATDGSVAGVNTLSVWMQNKPDRVADYTFDNNRWKSLTPFYIENLTGNEALFARHTPVTTDAVTSLPDVLGNTTGAKMDIATGGVNFTLKHLYARLNLSLVQGEGFPQAIDLANTTLTLNGFRQSADLDDTNVATATGEIVAYTAITDGSLSASLVVVPQAVAAGTSFVVTLKSGTSYTATLAKDMVLEAGKIHTLTLTLEPTAVKLGLTVSPWATGNEMAQRIVVSGLSSEEAAGSFIPQSGDRLTLAAGNQTAVYLYATGKWTSNAPLYWDMLSSAGTHTFEALIAPAAVPAAAEAAKGEVADYLWGRLSNVAFGKPLSFNIEHIMAQVSVILKAGEGFVDGDLRTATITLPGLKPLKSVAGNGTIVLEATASSTPLTLIRQTDAQQQSTLTFGGKLIAPQQKAKDEPLAIVSLTVNGNPKTYVLKTPAAGYYFEGKKNNRIEITLVKTGPSIGFTVSGWTDKTPITGTPGLDY